MKKVIFIINSVSNQRCIKRVNEFVNNGYDVIAYGFSRKLEMYNQPKIAIEIVGEYDNFLSYGKRLFRLYRSIGKIVAKHKQDDVVYYLFGLDIAMVYFFLSRKQYIYEESDMTHTYIANKLIRNVFELIDRYVIRNSLRTVFTSEGFAKYHFKGKNKIDDNIVFIPNKLDPSIRNINMVAKGAIDIEHLKIGFVGGVRFESIFFFAKYVLENYPCVQIHFFGKIVDKYRDMFMSLQTFENSCYFHGSFKNPDDLPNIYSQIDLVLSTYDIKFDNVRYAEPNKLYEAIYFSTPIIVSENTFLSDKVKQLDIGYVLNPFSSQSIDLFFRNLTIESIEAKRKNAFKLGADFAINCNDSFFLSLNTLLNKPI